MKKIIAIFCSVLLITTACNTPSKEKEEATVQEGLSKEMYNLDLKGFGAQDMNLKELKGQVVFLNFWATWCPPCVKEMPSIQQLYNDYKGQVKFVLISMEEPTQDHQNFVKENNYTLPVYEATSLMHKDLRPVVFPTTIILDKNGKVVLKEEGGKDWNTPEVRELLQNLVKD